MLNITLFLNLLKHSGTKIKIGFRLSNYDADNQTADANVYLMAPEYSTAFPALYDGDFKKSKNVSDYANVTATEGASGKNYMTIKSEDDENQYLFVDAKEWTGSQIRLQMTTNPLKPNTEYKVSFKTKGDMTTTDDYGRLDASFYKADNATSIGTDQKRITNKTLGSLGTYDSNSWTEYVGYFTTPANDAGGVVVRLLLWTKTGYSNAYDDVMVTEAENETIVYQNGVTTNQITAGQVASARYHNISAHNTTFMVAYYEESIDKKLSVMLSLQ